MLTSSRSLSVEDTVQFFWATATKKCFLNIAWKCFSVSHCKIIMVWKFLIVNSVACNIKQNQIIFKSSFKNNLEKSLLRRSILKHIFWNMKYTANKFEKKIVLNYNRISNKRKNDWKWKQDIKLNGIEKSEPNLLHGK